MSEDPDDEDTTTGRRELLDGATAWRPDSPDDGKSGRRSVLRRTGMMLFATVLGIVTLGQAEASWMEYKCVEGGCRTRYPCTHYQRVCWPSGCDSWEWDGCCGSC